MIITLDGRKLEGPFESASTLQALIDDVRTRHAVGKLIVSVALDGRLLEEQSLDTRLAASATGFTTLELESADGRALAAAALRELSVRVASAGPDQVALSDRITASQSGVEIGRLSELIALWQDCRDTIIHCVRVTGLDLTAMEVDGAPVRAHCDELTSKLRELRDALDARDFVLTADLLRYEMAPMCETWSGLLASLGRLVADTA